MLSNQRGLVAVCMFPIVLFVAWAVGAGISGSGLPGADATGFRWALVIVVFGVVMSAWAIVTEPGEG